MSKYIDLLKQSAPQIFKRDFAWKGKYMAPDFYTQDVGGVMCRFVIEEPSCIRYVVGRRSVKVPICVPVSEAAEFEEALYAEARKLAESRYE